METQTQQEQNQPERELTKKERRQIRREEKKHELENTRKATGRKNMLVWAVVVILVLAAGFGIYKYLSSDDSVVYDPTKSCINHAGAGMHIHPNLRITVNGQDEEIPANTGVSAGCMRPLHAHDSTGRLHIEFPSQRNFTLGEFFKVWGKNFSSSQILDYATDEIHTISMTVNGQESTEYENLIFKDADRIEIKYETISE